MVEHMSAQTTQHQHQQSFNGVQTQRWPHHHRHHRRDSESISSDITISPGAIAAASSTTTNGRHHHHHHRFSLFRWFRRRDSTSSADNRRRQLFRRAKRRPSTSSTSSSADTFYSTATVRSFAFHSGVPREAGGAALTLEQSSCAVGPFAPGAVKLVDKRKYRNDELRGVDAATTCTLPSAFSQRQDIRTRYSLHPVNSPFISYDSIPVVERRPRTFAEVRRINNKNNNNNNNNTAAGGTSSVTSDSSLSGARRVHVKGKRRAPDPPVQRIVSVHVASGSGSGCARPASGGRRKRRAPKPPGYTETLSSNQDTLSSGTSTGMDTFVTAKDCQTISNDTLVLRRGVLLSKRDVRSSSRSSSRTPTTSVCDSDGGTIVSNQTAPSSGVGVNNKSKLGAIMPRPWYKRNVFNDHSSGGSRDSTTNTRRSAGGGDILRGLSSPIPSHETKDEIVSSTSTSSTLSSSFPFEGSLSRLGFFHRGDRHHHDDKKKENKRKSGVSILTNISELDKEAAAIVQEEQARNRASMLLEAARLEEDFERRMGVNQEIVEGIVNASMESSPRRSTRALISKFNAIGNITRVTVNSSFFTKNNSASPKAKNKRYSRECCNNSQRDSILDERVERDLSKYFLPHQSSPKRESASIFTEIVESGKPKTTTPDVKASTVPTITTTNVPAATTVTTPAKTTTTTTTTTTASPKIETKNNNAEFANNLTVELDDVATGIARLRRELDARPAQIKEAEIDREKKPKQKEETPVTINKFTAARDKELANFDKEFTKIFDEIDRQLKTRDSRIAATKARTSLNANETSIKNQVAKVLDILVGAEKEAAATKNAAAPQPPKEIIKPSNSTENSRNKEAKMKEGGTTGVVRISGVDDKTTADLKEMLKEMKHSLPKRPKAKKGPETEDKPHESLKVSEVIIKKPSTSSYRLTTEELGASPKSSSTKVSSGVQTSGNVRRIINEVPVTRPKVINVVPEASLKNGLPRSSYQLIKANEFAEMEAAKSSSKQPPPLPEITYANVIERSMYANAQVPSESVTKPVLQEKKKKVAGGEKCESRVKIDLRGGDSGVTASSALPQTQLERNDSQGTEKSDSGEEGEKLEEIKKQYMNTLAVNRLLRKLEAAIASGHHQQAAGLAKELAQLKIHCSVVRQRSCSAMEKLNLSMYIEDKQAHQGPIPLQLPVNMTVAQLKAKIHIEFEIPANVQRWIIGKNLADNDGSTLEELQAVEGSPVFLYLVAPPDLQDKEAIKVDKREVKEEEDKDREKEEIRGADAAAAVAVAVAVAAARVINEKNDEQIHVTKTEIEPGPVEAAQAVVIVEEPVPEVKSEPHQQEPRQEKEETLTKEEKLKRYEELMSLENCDVISNTEPIECPVCFMIAIQEEGVILRDCLHSFCRVCVANTVRYCEDAEVKCPYRDADYTCESTLQEREIKALVAPEVYQQHLAKSIAQAENNAGKNAFHCKTPDCPGWCIYDDNVNNFLCPVCKVNNCLTCQAVHMGKNCRQYQEELKYSKETDHESKRTAAMLEEMVDRGEALPCPTCAVVLMKKWGCDWLRCSMCKTEICWVTRGPRWGPAGKGDTSGGCRCGENGVKCHPRCNYCH